MSFLYYEECNNTSMTYYPFFVDRLKKIQKLVKKIYLSKINDSSMYQIKRIALENNYCPLCLVKNLFMLGNILWDDNLIHVIKVHKTYPSEYFVKIILSTIVLQDYIVNPPISIEKKKISNFKYIPLHHNKLLIMDALMKQGSEPRYLVDKNDQEKYIYSEHSGVISVNNDAIDNIIVSTETNRIDINDSNIYLPINTEIFKNHEYLFHTHPNTDVYGGRINEGIVYEFPSANDLFNFMKFYNNGKALSSIIIAPEGIYVLRPVEYDFIIMKKKMFNGLKKFILELESLALNKYKKILHKIQSEDEFHSSIGSDLTFIKFYNKYLEKTNLFIEYYPRIKKNGEWYLPQINLQYVK